MLELFSLIWFCLLVAALIGGIIVWLLLRSAIDRERNRVETEWRGKHALEVGRVQSLTAAQNEMNVKLQRIEANLANESTAHATLKALHNSTVIANTAKLSELDGTVVKLTADLAKSTTESKTRWDSLTALQGEQTSLKSQWDSLNRQFNELTTNHASLSSKHTKRDAEASDFLTQLNLSKQQIATVDTENSHLHKRLRELEGMPAQVVDRDNRIKVLDIKLAELQRLSVEQESGLKLRTIELDKLRADGAHDAKQASEKYAKLQHDWQNGESEIVRVRTERDQLKMTHTEAIARATQRYSTLESDHIKTLAGEQLRATSEITRLTSEITLLAPLKDQLLTAENDLSASAQKSQTLDAEIIELRRRIDHEENEHRAFKSKLLTVEEKLAHSDKERGFENLRHQDEIAQLRKQIEERQHTINTRDNTLRLAEVARMDAVHMADARGAEVVKLANANSELDIAMTGLRSQVNGLEGQVEERNAKLHKYDELVRINQIQEVDLSKRKHLVEERDHTISALRLSMEPAREKLRQYEELSRIVRSQESALSKYQFELAECRKAKTSRLPLTDIDGVQRRVRLLEADLTSTRDEYAAYRLTMTKTAVKIETKSGDDIAPSQTTPVLAAWGAKRPNIVDDLKLIWGVGPKLEKMLHDLGIFTFRQIANWTSKDIAEVDARLAVFHGRILRDNWVAGAKEEHFKKYNEKI